MMRSATLFAICLTWGCAVDLRFDKRDGQSDTSIDDVPDADTSGDLDTDPDVPDSSLDVSDTLDAEDVSDAPEGTCTSDGECVAGEICRPACFRGSGCGVPPASMDVDCPEVTTLPASGECSIALDGVAGQVACLDCEALLGPVTLSSTDFGAGGSCTLGGWSLVSGSECFSQVDSCTGIGTAEACCSAGPTIRSIIGGDCRLVSDRATNCGGGVEEWRLTRTFDTSGLHDIEVCFGVGGNSATADEGLLVIASDSTSSDQVHCTNGLPVVRDGTVSPDDVKWPVCTSLPSWANDNDAVTITFVAHSEQSGDAVHLDDVVVRGWSTPCTPGRTTLLTESFSTCTTGLAIPADYNGWTVSGAGSLECSNGCGSGKSAVGRRDRVTMTRTVDTTSVHGDVRLCFNAGDVEADAGEGITVLFDAGSGWQEAWHWENDFGTDGSCEVVCLVLSDIDPAVAGIPDLGIRFDLDSSQHLDLVFLDEIVLGGATYCPAAGNASIGSLTDLGDGAYSFDLVDDAGTQMGAFAHCSWDTPEEPVRSEDGTWFQ